MLSDGELVAVVIGAFLLSAFERTSGLLIAGESFELSLIESCCSVGFRVKSSACCWAACLASAALCTRHSTSWASLC